MSPLSRLTAACVVALVATAAVHAQQRSVRPATTTAPSANARAAQAAPNPAGLRPPNPAGLTAGSGAAVSGDPIAAGHAAAITRGTAPNTVAGGPAGADGDGGDTGLSGAGAAGLPARGSLQPVPMGSGGNPVEVARAFINADSNHDGELTRNEASRLGIAFEEMDRDFDGVVTRAEYGDGRR